MEERSNSNRNRGGLVWLLALLAALITLGWYSRPDQDGATSQRMRMDQSAALDMDPDDILVDLRDDAGEDVIAAIERELGVDLELLSDESYNERLYRVHVAPEQQAALVAALAKHPAVEIAEPDAYVHATPIEMAPMALDTDTQWEGFPNDPMYKFQWHLQQIDMPEAWKLADGEGVIVAVIDTGVAFEDRERFRLVPDLSGARFVHPYNFLRNNTQAHDDHGHGTHVAGTIAQVTHNGVGVAGVARNATIMPLKVLAANGSGSVGAIADAIHFAADNGAAVINMSLGGRFPSLILKKAVEYAHQKGVVVVCAAGNESRGKVSYPAAYPGSIAVSATQFDESITFYSNYGEDIDVAAPGGNTRVDQNGDGMPDGVLQNTIAIGDPGKNDYFPYMGTSMASPHVAGVAALVVGEGVTEPNAVEQLLKDTARRPNNQTYEKLKYGAGIVDARAAVLKARGESGAWQLALGLLIAGVVASSLRKRGLLITARALGPSYLIGVMIGASGLFFVPYLSGALTSLPGMEILSRGLPSWNLGILGPEGHGNALFFSALIPFALLSAFFHLGRLRAPLAGLAAGVAGHLLFHAVVRVTDIQYIPNLLMFDGTWLVVNALACVGMAHLALRR